MPANRMNYLVWYAGESQVYGTATREIALETPPPSGRALEDKRIAFISFEPDTLQLVLRILPPEEVLAADLKEAKPRKKKEDEEA